MNTYENYKGSYADKFVSSGPPPQPTTTMSNVDIEKVLSQDKIR